jgi:hypothetical protein
MSTPTIASPGVQINERDLSLIARPIGATDVLITGFASQGPTEDLVNVGSVSEFESIYGTPTNAAERYLYHTARQVLSQSPANVLVSRIPYGAQLGEGYTNSYSALVYPISSDRSTFAESSGFRLLPPTSILLDEDQYYKIVSGDIEWQDSAFDYSTGNLLTPFGPLTFNADDNNNYAITTTNSVTSSRIYGLQETSFLDLNNIQLDNLGIGAVPGTSAAAVHIHGIWSYFSYNTASSGWDIPETATAYSTASADDPDIQFTLATLISYVVSASYNNQENPDLVSTYGDAVSFVTNISSYYFDTGISVNQASTASDIILNGYGGLIILNTSKTAVNDLFEGYYVGIADNSNFNPSTEYNSIQELKAVHGNNGSSQYFVTVPPRRLNFTLTQNASSYVRDSVSKVIEQYPLAYDFSTTSFDDSLVVMLFKVKATQYGEDTIQLDYAVSEGYTGSLNANRTQQNQNGGTPVSFFIDTVINNKSQNIQCITNPYISTKGKWVKDDGKGTPAKTVVIDDTAKIGVSTGVYAEQNSLEDKDLGKVDLKIQRLLDILSNDDSTNIDIVLDAGLSTIWATSVAQKEEDETTKYIFDETYTPLDIDNTDGIANKQVNIDPTGLTLDAYQTITDIFVKFAEARRDHIFISDPLRQIFVRGKNSKVSSKKNFVFSNEIWWPLNNIYNSIQSSYVASYGNWIKVNDPWYGQAVWQPSSGHAAAIIAKSSQATYPWIAPAGFNRGTLTNVLDIAVNPTQRQRDLLYKINLNPIAFFNQDGFVIYGQKTFYRKPSAFDRINVRRLFLTLEKTAQRLLKYFVFEPNSFATRNRLKGALTPIFDQAKINEGCYDYMIVCDTTNNTPDVIDNNELRVSIYIQPVRSAEFILADFIATRTGVNFSELIAGGQS